MGKFTEAEIMDILGREMVLSAQMRSQLLQMCKYAEIAGIDMMAIRKKLTEEGVLPCSNKNDSKKALSEIYDHVACSF